MSVLKIKDENEQWTSIPTIKGDTGDAAGFGTVSATIDTTAAGTPSVDVTASGQDTAKNFAFAFHNVAYDDTSLKSRMTAAEGDIDDLEADVATYLQSVGSPLVAATVASMTDHTKIYVYTGSETGYTAGNWYYWDGDSWESGGVYNSTALNTDKTLLVADAAADAEVVGEKITDLKSDIKDLNGAAFRNLFDPSYAISGGYYNSSGAIISHGTSEYIEEYIPIDSALTYLSNSAYLQILTYDSSRTFIERAYNQETADTQYTFSSSVAYIRLSNYGHAFGDDFIFADTESYPYVSTYPLVINGEKVVNLDVDESDCAFFHISPNRLNTDDCVKDKFVDGDNGNINNSNGSEISGLIAVSNNDVLNFTPQSALYIVFYNTSKTFINRVSVASTASTYTVPQDGYVRFARYQHYFDDEFMVTINEDLPTTYHAYGSYIFDYEDDSGKEALQILDNMAHAGIATKTSSTLTITIGKFRIVANRYYNDSIRAYNIWRTNNGYLKDSDGNFNQIWYNSDADGVVKILGEDDFIGGYHGDETSTSFKLFIDGIEYANDSAFSNLAFDEIKMYCESDVYHCNTSASADTVAFKRHKILTFNKDGYSVGNYWVAQENLVLTRAYMGMLSVERFTDNTYTDYLINGYHTNHDFAYKDANTGTGASNDITEVLFNTIYGDVGIKIEQIVTPQTYYGEVANYNSVGDKRLKAYLANINSNNGVSVAQGAVIKAKATTFIR